MITDKSLVPSRPKPRNSLRREMLREHAFDLHISGFSVREIAATLDLNKATVCSYLAVESASRAQEFAVHRNVLIAQSIAIFRNQQRILTDHQHSDPDHTVAAAKAIMTAQTKIDTLLGIIKIDGTAATQIPIEPEPIDQMDDAAKRQLLVALAAAT